MIDIIVERQYDTPKSEDEVLQMASDAAGCLPLYQIEWQQSFFSASGDSLVCHYKAPDLESVRLALRQLRSDYRTAWITSVHPAGIEDSPTVMVCRRFDEPVAIEDLQAQEDAHGGCLKARNVRFVHSYFSHDKTRMLCLYAAPDADSVRQAQHLAGMPVENVWAFRLFQPD